MQTSETPNPGQTPVVHQSGQGIDWDAFFEGPENGVISMLSRAQTIEAMAKIAELIVSTLFSRAGDEERRRSFRSLLRDLMQGKDGEGQMPSNEVVRYRLVQLMRGIKDERVVRARLTSFDDDDQSQLVLRGAERRRDETEIVAPESRDHGKDPQWRVADGGDEQTAVTPFDEMPPPSAMDEALADVIVASIEERFFALKPEPQSTPVPGRLPFILAPGFVTRYTATVREHIMPLMATRCRSVTASVAEQPREHWRRALAEASSERKHRLALWEAWQSAWLERTTKALTPPRPDDQIITPGAQDRSDNLTLDAWETQVDFLKRQNAQASAVWSRFSAFADDYHAPLDQDNRMLMELFGRSASGLAEQIDALLRIANHKDNPTKLFESYQRGKSIDCTLLAACYRYPEVFLAAERPMLSVLLRNYGRRRRLEGLPLVSRFLGDRIR